MLNAWLCARYDFFRIIYIWERESLFATNKKKQKYTKYNNSGRLPERYTHQAGSL